MISICFWKSSHCAAFDILLVSHSWGSNLGPTAKCQEFAARALLQVAAHSGLVCLLFHSEISLLVSDHPVVEGVINPQSST